MVKMTSRWMLLFCGVEDARSPRGFIFLSACDVTVCGALRPPMGAGIPASPFFLPVLGEGGKEKIPSSQLATAEADHSPLALCAYVCASVSLLVGRSDVAGREAGTVTFSKQN